MRIQFFALREVFRVIILREGPPHAPWSAPTQWTLGSAVLHKFFLKNGSNYRALRDRRRLKSSGPGVRSYSAFVCLLRPFRSSYFSAVSYAKPVVKHTI